MIDQSVESVSPHRAVRTSGTHVVNHEQLVVVAEQLVEADASLRRIKYPSLDGLCRQLLAQFHEFLVHGHLRLFKLGDSLVNELCVSHRVSFVSSGTSVGSDDGASAP